MKQPLVCEKRARPATISAAGGMRQLTQNARFAAQFEKFASIADSASRMRATTRPSRRAASPLGDHLHLLRRENLLDVLELRRVLLPRRLEERLGDFVELVDQLLLRIR